MPLASAPLFTDIRPGLVSGAAYWAKTSDGIKIRLGVWEKAEARGTVLIFPGRTEYVEKYGDSAAEFSARGFASVAIDWRGQGLADRLLDDPLTGHIDNFSSYQKDVGAMLRAVRELNLPRPYFLLGHSMGGCIGLRALIEGLAVQAAAFTGPMWGIYLSPHMRLAAYFFSTVMQKLKQGHRLPFGTTREPYVLSVPFDDNMLTTDAEMLNMMRDQIIAHPALKLGGPSYVWLRQALAETRHLSQRAVPNLPCNVYVGSNERIVDVPRIEARMKTWKGGQLHSVKGGEHEVLMEVPSIREPIFDEIAKLFLTAASK